MVAIYVRWIEAGHMTIEQVPERWREKVQVELDAGHIEKE